jgi:hypothetical protein
MYVKACRENQLELFQERNLGEIKAGTSLPFERMCSLYSNANIRKRFYKVPEEKLVIILLR